MCLPALVALSFIRGDEINYARARNAGLGKSATNFQRIFDLSKNVGLYVFAGCIFLFQLADASMLPVIGEDLALNKSKSASLLMAGLIVTPQIIAAVLSPWVGYNSEKFGRKPLLLIGFGVEALRGLLFAFFTGYPALLIGQCLGGISAAAVTVITVLMIADMTTGTGRFNLVQGFIGTIIAIAAGTSTGVSTGPDLSFSAPRHWPLPCCYGWDSRKPSLANISIEGMKPRDQIFSDLPVPGT